MLKTAKKHLAHATALVQHALRDVGTSAKRSSAWPKTEKAWLTVHDTCAACGGRVRLNVHHKTPFHVQPELELDMRNLITLCMEIDKHCHLKLGHGGNFKAFVPFVEELSRAALVARRMKKLDVVREIEKKAEQQRQLDPVQLIAA